MLFQNQTWSADKGYEKTYSTKYLPVLKDIGTSELLPMAQKGDVQAQTELGLRYKHGNGISVDNAKSAKWFRTAAEKGYDKAQYYLGVAFAHGTGVRQDNAEAVRWYRKAAEQGMSWAESNLAGCYEEGRGVLQDWREAVRLYRHAAEQGFPVAQNNLGMCCWDGRGTPQDYIEAYKWLNLAAASGMLPAARENRTELAKVMTPAQIAESQRRAAAFVPAQQSEQKKGNANPDTTVLKASGTGFFVSTNGFVLTAAHVVTNASRIMMRTAGKLIEAKVVKCDAVNDVAVLRVDESSSALPILNSEDVKLGEPVFTIGFPNVTVQGVEPKLTRGDVNGLGGIQDDPRHFQVSVPIQPGNSGGPLVNMDGKVIGILVSRLSDAAALEATGMLPQNVNYALKSGYAIALMKSIPAPYGTEAFSKLPRSFERVVKEVQAATVMLLIY